VKDAAIVVELHAVRIPDANPAASCLPRRPHENNQLREIPAAGRWRILSLGFIAAATQAFTRWCMYQWNE
jgi:hypothetical protein